MASAEHASFLPPIVTFCAAAVVAVPIARRLRLGSVLGYLSAGVVIGPSALGFIRDTESVRGIAEIGVVLLLFVIGLELKIARLLTMSRAIFGTGGLQMFVTATAIGAVAMLLGVATPGAITIGLALALSATAVALQILGERGELQDDYGQQTFSVLLFQDLSIVPILALVPILASSALGSDVGPTGIAGYLLPVASASLALAIVVLSGRYALNPLFALLAKTDAREVLTAAALMIVLGTGLLMEVVGLSMALGAFLAGVLLAESNFRHQLEADIEPFRGLLLGLFFMSVGMSIDLGFVWRNLPGIVGLAVGLTALKSLCAYAIFRTAGTNWRDGARAAVLLAPAGEFAFVLVPLAASSLLFSPNTAAWLTASAALTMFIGPVKARLFELWLQHFDAKHGTQPPEPDEDFSRAKGSILVIGAGRFGQFVNQVLLAEDIDVTVIDKDVERLKGAARFGFKYYYGDGTRLDVLHAAGAARAKIVCVCVDDKAAALTIVELLQTHFEDTKIFVRAFDRIHAIELMNRDVDYQMRETFQSALVFGQATLEAFGVSPSRAADVAADVAARDAARLIKQQADGIMGGLELLHRQKIEPEPLSAPRTKAKALTAETRAVVGDGSNDVPGDLPDDGPLVDAARATARQ